VRAVAGEAAFEERELGYVKGLGPEGALAFEEDGSDVRTSDLDCNDANGGLLALSVRSFRSGKRMLSRKMDHSPNGQGLGAIATVNVDVIARSGQ
jgi:hypothetical protein